VTLTIFLAALGSAVLHALWNAAARMRPDPGNGLASVVVMAGVLGVPLMAVVGPPPLAAVKWLLLGAGINLLTMRALMATYRRTPFAVGYPIVRGMAPLNVTLLTWLFLGDTISPLAVGGIAAITAGMLLLAESARRGAKFDRVGLAMAIAAGFCNALFVLTDVQGVRVSGDPLTYGAATCVVNSLTMLGMLAFEGRRVTGLLRGNIRFGLLASFLSTGSYLLVLYGFASGPSGPVSALRETSVFFGLILAGLMLREPVGPLRWTAAGLAVIGAGLIRLS
jgi:drug/metabolite transporter (DMT)-like permease